MVLKPFRYIQGYTWREQGVTAQSHHSAKQSSTTAVPTPSGVSERLSFLSSACNLTLRDGKPRGQLNGRLLLGRSDNQLGGYDPLGRRQSRTGLRLHHGGHGRSRSGNCGSDRAEGHCLSSRTWRGRRHSGRGGGGGGGGRLLGDCCGGGDGCGCGSSGGVGGGAGGWRRDNTSGRCNGADDRVDATQLAGNDNFGLTVDCFGSPSVCPRFVLVAL